ncbi:SLC13 family permease [Homoserinibacter sp. YIM 151385]|uniref:SLC13 family permease n=1 Tax=Homoserinibacter sp. YIM 151385 TaxID=2985506 RepID=UPI0022F131E5|nr:DASS family sodium-coupled anion symporter [Homoserinibacter sp. YIM 151385]WBU37091.1 DASS family sodium-coupled anion symporter [Homoserinibacter sp. YIM 151385]
MSEQKTASLEMFRAYKSIGDQAMTPAEERFERRRQTSGLILAPLLGAVMLFAPLDLPWNQQSLAAVFIFTMVLWLTEAIPIPIASLLGVALMILFGVAPANEVLASFGNTIVLLYLGAFFLAQALLKHGVAQRIAYSVLGSRVVGDSVVKMIVAFGAVTCVFSAFVSNTVTVAMLLPTALGLIVAVSRQLGQEDPTKLRIGTALLLMLSFSASIGGAITPVGAPHQLIGRDLIEAATGNTISFFSWVGVALCAAIPLFGFLVLLLTKLNKPEVTRLAGLRDSMRAEREKAGRMSRGGVAVLAVFGLVVIGWLTPGFLGLVAGTESEIYTAVGDVLDEGIVAIVGAALLFLIPVAWKKREFAMTWGDAVKTDWGTLLFIICAAAFGSQLSSTGLAERVGQLLGDTFGVADVVVLTFVAVLLAILISEVGSNLAAVGVVVPIVISICTASGIDPTLPALAATFGSSFGFMLPISTPQNALVYATGAVPITRMVRSGIVFDVLAAVFVTASVTLTGRLFGIV